MEPLAAQSEFEQRKLYRIQLASQIIVDRSRGQRVPFMKGLQDHPGQQEMLFTQWKYFVAPWGRRAGKTICASFWLTEGLAIEGFREWILAPDYELTDKAFRYVYQWVVKDQVLGEGSVEKASESKRIIKLKWGSFLQGKSMLSESIIGEELDRVLLDEAARLTERTWTESIEPCLMDRDGDAMFCSTGRGRNWFHRIFERRLDPELRADGWAGCIFWSKDNPFHDPAWLERKRKTTPENEFRREYECSFEDYAGLIYQDYRDSLWLPNGKGGHLYDPKKMQFDVTTDYRAIDVGWRHPTACVWAKAVRTPEDDLYIYREYLGKPGTTHEEHAKNISMLSGKEKIYDNWISPDAKRQHGLHATSEQRTCANDIYRDSGIYCRAAVDDVGAGIDIVRAYLAATLQNNPHHPKLFISQECEHLRAGLLEYIYQDVQHRSERDQPEAPRKYRDDMVDAVRYLCAGHPHYVSVTWDENNTPEQTLAERYGYQETNRSVQQSNNSSIRIARK